MSYIRKYNIDVNENKIPLVKIINDISKLNSAEYGNVEKIIQKNPKKDKKVLSKSSILLSYDKLKKTGNLKLTTSQEANFLRLVRMKNIRTLSGVTPVTVLTKPFPCPGKCIFCPNDIRMPKSYLTSEPGAQRAEANRFDPYYQTFNRLLAFRNMGHPTDKIELIILGGTWSSYPEFYQIWFVKKCFDAMNDFGKSKRTKMLKPPEEQPFDEKIMEQIKTETTKKTYNRLVTKALSTKLSKAKNESATWAQLFAVHKVNETAKTRCVGLVVETRPDEIKEEEVLRLRRLGATKVQIGIQSMDDKVLELNKRGHNSMHTKRAINLLRQAGFKIHAHWMPNLYGSSTKKDVLDFKKLFSKFSVMPDELKVYPCSLIASAELMEYYKKGLWKPYTEKQLLYVLTQVLINTPVYCRLTRIIRDIPSQDIVVGNKKTNFRQIAEKELEKLGIKCKDIRSREIRGATLEKASLKLKTTKYKTEVSQEVFLEYVNEEDQIAGFLRLSLPIVENFTPELEGSAIIREVHVYGQSIELGKLEKGKAQHVGLGKKLIKRAEEIAALEGFKYLSVISSVGTREYYKKLGFNLEKLYQNKATTLLKKFK